MKTEDWGAVQWAEYYDKQSYKNYMIYQETGEPRYDKTARKYELIADAFRAKAEKDADHGEEMKKRMNNMKHAISQLYHDSYSRAAVIELLQKAVWW